MLKNSKVLLSSVFIITVHRAEASTFLGVNTVLLLLFYDSFKNRPRLIVFLDA